VARPEKLTPEVQQKIVDAIRLGNYIETAAAYAGISKSTLYDWLKKGGRARSGKYRVVFGRSKKRHLPNLKCGM